MKRKLIVIFTITLFLSSVSLFAQIKVISLKGKVSYKAGRQWKQLKRNQILNEGTKISSGTNSYAVLQLNRHRHLLEIKPLTVLKVYGKSTAVRSNTHIGLKRGKVRARVAKNSRVRTVFKISTPVATSSVRGTIEDVAYGPARGMRVNVIEGAIEGENRNGKSTVIRGRQVFSQQGGSAAFGDTMKDVRGRSFAGIHGEGLTPEELAFILMFGDDFQGSPGGDTQILDNQTGGPATVNIEIVWPDGV